MDPEKEKKPWLTQSNLYLGEMEMIVDTISLFTEYEEQRRLNPIFHSRENLLFTLKRFILELDTQLLNEGTNPTNGARTFQHMKYQIISYLVKYKEREEMAARMGFLGRYLEVPTEPAELRKWC